MPDGVTIPGGPSFAGTPQPPDVPCDPTGEGWRGPPGPQGPPGTDSGIGEAPVDGAVYGRQGSSTSWLGVNSVAAGGPFLPLSGGTVTGPISSTSSTVLSTPTGFNLVSDLPGSGGIPAFFPTNRLMFQRQAPAWNDFCDVQFDRLTSFTGGTASQFNACMRVIGRYGAGDATNNWNISTEAHTSAPSNGATTVGIYSVAGRDNVAGAGGAVWGGIMVGSDETGLPSASGAGVTGAEIDVGATGLDNAGNGAMWGGQGNRVGIDIVGVRVGSATSPQTEIAAGLWITTTPVTGGTTDPYTAYLSGVSFGSNTQLYQAFDTRGAIVPAGYSSPFASLRMQHEQIIDFNGGASLKSLAGNYLQYTTAGTPRLRYMVGSTEVWSISDTGVGSGAFIPTARFLTVEDFGAKGDGTTDDIAAFDAYTAYLRAQITAGKSPMLWELGANRVYLVSRSINLTGFSHFRFNGNHSVIVSTDLTHPCVDLLGSDNFTLENLKVVCGSQATPGLTGIIYGLYADNQSHGQTKLDNVTIDGYFTRAAAHNSGSEVNTISFPIFINRYTSGTPGSSYVLLMDGLHHWALGSRYVTSTLTADTYLSFLGTLTLGGSLQHTGDGSCLWDGGGSQHHYRGTYMQVYQTVPAAVLAFATGAGANLKHDFIFEVHSETAPSCALLFTVVNGTTNVLLSGATITDEGVQVITTGTYFKSDAGAAAVYITDADIRLPFWHYGGTKLFDTPSKYHLTSKLTMLSFASGNYNAPGSGTVHLISNDASGFTLGTYGSTQDPNGYFVDASSAIVNGSAYVGGAATLAGNVGFHGITPIAKPTGWAAATGTATRTTFVTGSVTLPALAEHVKALIDDLTAYGLIGP